MKLNFLKFGLLFFVISFISCDGWTGMGGIVKDSETEKVIEGVKIEMTSHYKTINTTTNELGEFSAAHHYSCGIIKCTDKFSIKFEKEGYETLLLDQNFRNEKDTNRVVVIDYDNAIIKLKKLESE